MPTFFLTRKTCKEIRIRCQLETGLTLSSKRTFSKVKVVAKMKQRPRKSGKLLPGRLSWRVTQSNCAVTDNECHSFLVFVLYPGLVKRVVFSCGEADNSSRDKLCSSFFLLSVNVQKKVQTVLTNMVAYVVWAINFKSDFRFDHQGCLEAMVASKLHFLCCSLIDQSS